MSLETREPVYAQCMTTWCGLDGFKCGACLANEYIDELLADYKKARAALRKPLCSCCQTALANLPQVEEVRDE